MNGYKLTGRIVFQTLRHVKTANTVIKVDKGEMKVEWNMKDVELPRFSYEGLQHHALYTKQAAANQYSAKRREEGKAERETLKSSVFSQSKVKVITPDV